MSEQDRNENTEIETVETTATESKDSKEHKEDEYEKICFICHRPESIAGKMIDLPNNICVCGDCMQKSFDAMKGGQIDYSQLLNMRECFMNSQSGAEYPKAAECEKEKRGRGKESLC